MVSEFRLPAAAFESIHPFGFVARPDGRLLSVGKALRRYVQFTGETSVLERFEVKRPVQAQGLAAFQPGRFKNLVVCAEGLELGGYTVAIESLEPDSEDTSSDPCFAFLGSPVVRSLEELSGTELKLGDFPPNDATPNLLLSMQLTHSALRDSRELSDSLREALEASRAATEAKSRFLAVMSHEIRTPLNGIGSLVDLLHESLPAHSPESGMLRLLDQSANDLKRILTDILDFSKIEAGSLELAPEPIPLTEYLEAALAPLRAVAQEKCVELHLHLDAGLPTHISIDPLRVRQILTNLVGNAVKFTSEGSVVIRTAKASLDRWTVQVEDSGVGIPAASREQLFEPFSQADASTTREFGGSGLGLAIARDMARAMGGDVTLVESTKDGSHFRLELPLIACAAPPTVAIPSEASERPDYTGCCVLLAEDNPTNQRVLTLLLERLGLEVTLAQDGLQAVEAVRSRRFDLVLMDRMMPNLDGEAACRRIRRLALPWRDLPIVACTASAFDEDRERAREAGMQGFLEKPVRMKALQEVLVQHLRKRAA